MIAWRLCPDCSTWALGGAYPGNNCLRCLADDRIVELVDVRDTPTRDDQTFRVKHKSSKKRITRVLRLEPSRQTGRRVWVERAVDGHNDWYQERVLDPDQVDPLREVAHPLSLHRGRGRDDSDDPFEDLAERGLELAGAVHATRAGFVWHFEVWRDERGKQLRSVLRDRHGHELAGVPDNARGLMQVHDVGQGICDRCDQLAFHTTRNGSEVARFCFDHLFS
jgi:hypothetical protein